MAPKYKQGQKVSYKPIGGQSRPNHSTDHTTDIHS